MCEYCGCQSVPAIAELTAEHDQIREVARDLDAVAQRQDLPVAVELAGRLLTLLAPHTAVEERGLFPAMAGEFGAHVASLADDHRRIERVLGDLAAGDPADGWPLRVRAVVAELFDHILREQDGLFPAALSVLSTQQWEHLDEVRRSVARCERAEAFNTRSW
jgi:hemerythrin-like domain-containing protein